MDVTISIDGHQVETIRASDKNAGGAMDLGAWNAETGGNKMSVAWYSIRLRSPLPKGPHSLSLVAMPVRVRRIRVSDSRLLGGQVERQAAKGASPHMPQTLQIDVFLLSR